MRNQTTSSAIQMEEIGFEKEWKEWDTDSIVQEACERVFGSEFTGWCKPRLRNGMARRHTRNYKRSHPTKSLPGRNLLYFPGAESTE